MNVVKVITRKIPKSSIANCTFIQFSNDLTQAASSHIGFLNSTSYWENVYLYNDNSSLYTISDWESLHNWEHWESSQLRNDILKEYKMEFELCTHTILSKRMKINDLPLL